MSKKITTKKILLTGFFVNLLDISLSLLALLLTGSVVMLAETLQGIVDTASATFLLVGLNRSNKRADKKHPFGYGREMYFWVLITSIVMATALSGLSIYSGVTRFLNPQPIENIHIALIILGVAVVSNGYSFCLNYKGLFLQKGKSIRDQYRDSLLVDLKTSLILDLIGTLAALVGILALLIYILTGNPQFDAIGAILIGVLIMVFARGIILSVKDLLIGLSISDSQKEKIKEAVLEQPEVLEVLDLKGTIIGPEKLLVNLEVHVRNGLTTDEIERLMDRIKVEINEALPDVAHVQIELETP